MATGAVVAGTGLAISAYGKYKEAQAGADALESRADASEAEANEMLRRAYINAGASLREGEGLIAQQVSGYASSGVEIGEGTPLTVMESTNEQITRQIGYDMEATRFSAEEKRRSAAFDRKSAGATRKAGIIAGIGGGAIAGARASEGTK